MGTCIGDTKIFAGVPSDPSGVGRMGAFVACGNTLPRARETVLGVEGGDRGGRVGMWDPRTGTGTVEAVKGQHTDAEGKCHVEALLFEDTYQTYAAHDCRMNDVLGIVV